jgi:hypothetical protein
MSRKLFGACVLVIVSFLLAGCALGKRPFLMVQMCLSNAKGIDEFIRELKSVAAAEKLKFVDNSGNAERELKEVGYAGRERTGGSRVIDVRVIRNDGMGIGASNVGLPGYQVAMGFSEGSDPSEAHRFADAVIKRLEQHWRVEKVPPGTGALPKPDCK